MDRRWLALLAMGVATGCEAPPAPVHGTWLMEILDEPDERGLCVQASEPLPPMLTYIHAYDPIFVDIQLLSAIWLRAPAPTDGRRWVTARADIEYVGSGLNKHHHFALDIDLEADRYFPSELQLVYTTEGVVTCKQVLDVDLWRLDEAPGV